MRPCRPLTPQHPAAPAAAACSPGRRSNASCCSSTATATCTSSMSTRAPPPSWRRSWTVPFGTRRPPWRRLWWGPSWWCGIIRQLPRWTGSWGASRSLRVVTGALRSGPPGSCALGPQLLLLQRLPCLATALLGCLLACVRAAVLVLARSLGSWDWSAATFGHSQHALTPTCAHTSPGTPACAAAATLGALCSCRASSAAAASSGAAVAPACRPGCRPTRS
jgi:hypothetical protein